MQLTREEVRSKVRDVIVDALGVDEDEVVSKASLSRDLGAESIDFLDITYRLERAFTTDPGQPFKIPYGELFPAMWPGDVPTEPNYIRNGIVTEKGLMLARQCYPDIKDLDCEMTFIELRDRLLVVAQIENYMLRRLGL